MQCLHGLCYLLACYYFGSCFHLHYNYGHSMNIVCWHILGNVFYFQVSQNLDSIGSNNTIPSIAKQSKATMQRNTLTVVQKLTQNKDHLREKIGRILGFCVYINETTSEQVLNVSGTYNCAYNTRLMLNTLLD